MELAREKVAEAEFFLGQLVDASDAFAVRCFFSATASAGYSALEALRAAASREEAFARWVSKQLDVLREDDLIAYLLARRNENVHIGETRIRSTRLPIGEGVPAAQHHFRLDPSTAEPVEVDIVTATQHFVARIISLIEDAVRQFPAHTREWLLDPRRRAEGISIEDVEERLGFPRGWSHLNGATEAQRLAAMAHTSPPPVLSPRFDEVAEEFMEFIRGKGADEDFRHATAYPVDLPLL